MNLLNLHVILSVIITATAVQAAETKSRTRKTAKVFKKKSVFFDVKEREERFYRLIDAERDQLISEYEQDLRIKSQAIKEEEKKEAEKRIDARIRNAECQVKKQVKNAYIEYVYEAALKANANNDNDDDKELIVWDIVDLVDQIRAYEQRRMQDLEREFLQIIEQEKNESRRNIGRRIKELGSGNIVEKYKQSAKMQKRIIKGFIHKENLGREFTEIMLAHFPTILVRKCRQAMSDNLVNFNNDLRCQLADIIEFGVNFYGALNQVYKIFQDLSDKTRIEYLQWLIDLACNFEERRDFNCQCIVGRVLKGILEPKKCRVSDYYKEILKERSIPIEGLFEILKISFKREKGCEARNQYFVPDIQGLMLHIAELENNSSEIDTEKNRKILQSIANKISSDTNLDHFLQEQGFDRLGMNCDPTLESFICGPQTENSSGEEGGVPGCSDSRTQQS